MPPRNQGIGQSHEPRQLQVRLRSRPLQTVGTFFRCSRRPCTVEGIATGLGLCPNEVLKHLDVLCAKGVIRTQRKAESVFYEGARDPS
jgi:hypothetical protein